MSFEAAGPVTAGPDLGVDVNSASDDRLGTAPLAAGDQRWIGPFQTLGVLGTGGIGRVYLARSDGDLAVVKVVRADLDSPEFRLGFARALATMRRIPEYAATVLEADVGAPQPWIATRYLAGLSLLEEVAAHGPLAEAAVWRLVHGVARALDGFHRIGVVHRDLKPSNVILTLDGPRVIDLGVAHIAGRGQLAVTGDPLGTASFTAPEQAQAQPVGPPADVFALGCLLVFAATGQPPFGPGTAPEILYRIAHEPPTLAGWPGRRLATLALGCLEKDPDRRPDLATVLAAVPEGDEQWPIPLQARLVQRAAAAAQVTAPAIDPPPGETTVGPTRRRPASGPARPSRCRRTQIAIGAVALAAVAFAGVGWWLSADAASAPATATTTEPLPAAGPAMTGPPPSGATLPPWSPDPQPPAGSPSAASATPTATPSTPGPAPSTPGSPQPSSVATSPANAPVRLVNRHTGLCVDDSVSPGLRHNTCKTDDNYQQWTLVRGHALTNVHNGLCLDDSTAGLRAITCNATKYQQWTVTAGGALVNVHTGLCVDDSVSQGLRDNTCTANDDYQQWTLGSI